MQRKNKAVLKNKLMSKKKIVFGNKTATSAITDEIKNCNERSDLNIIFKIVYNAREYCTKLARIINTETN